MRTFVLLQAVAALFLSLQQGWLTNAATWWGGVSTGRHAPSDTKTLEDRTVTTVATARQRLGVPPLTPDPVLRHWLLDCVRSGVTDPDSIAQSARHAWPQYQEMMVVRTYGAT